MAGMGWGGEILAESHGFQGEQKRDGSLPTEYRGNYRTSTANQMPVNCEEGGGVGGGIYKNITEKGSKC